MPKQITLYYFDELNAEAQERALREYKASDEWRDVSADFANDDIDEMIRESLHEYCLPSDDVEYSLSHSQGDGVAFYGTVASCDIVEFIGFLRQRKERDYQQKIIDAIEAGATFELNIKRNQFGRQYSHAHSMDVELDGDTPRDAADILYMDDILEMIAHIDGTDEWCVYKQTLLDGREAVMSTAMAEFKVDAHTFIMEVSKELEGKGYALIEHYDSDATVRDYLEVHEYAFFAPNGVNVYLPKGVEA